MANNKRHRPPHAEYEIRELIKLGKYDEAQEATDINVEFYRDRIGDQQSLFLEAQCARMGVSPTPENKIAVNSGIARR